jgi:N-acetyl-gamma-glutamyl-phosphate reductase
LKRRKDIVKASIINVTGYAGMELARLLSHHPEVEIIGITGRSEAGKKVGEVFHHLFGLDLVIDREPEAAEVIFSALPHRSSAEAILPFLEKGIRVIDLSADFRLKEAQEYQQWYDMVHPSPEWLQKAVYGLSELKREQISLAQLIANPGCYAATAILALAPAVKEGLIYPDIIIDVKSGVSGAGRTLSLGTHYSEVNENASAYALEGHRHLPEIVQELSSLSPQSPLAITFLPHVVPMTRGILCSAYARVVDGKLSINQRGKDEVRQIYQEFYQNEPFVKVLPIPPQTKYTWGSNFCLIHPTIDLRTGRLIVISCLDNLVKGAGGQAVQNMNLMFGLPETLGLEASGIYP